MVRFTRSALMLGAAALVSPAMAQTEADDDLNDSCLELFVFADENEAFDVNEMPELLAVVERNDAAECDRYLTRMERRARNMERGQRRQTERETERETAEQTETETETRTRRTTEQVQVEETVTVAGTVDVMTEAPEIIVDQAAPRVRVQESAPDVSVQSAGPEIVIEEQAPTIRVGMPTITITQPAPIIDVIMPDHEVDVQSAEPRVEVRQAPPQVKIAVSEPKIDFDLRAVPGEGEGGIQTRVSQAEPRRSRERSGMDLIARQDEGANADVYVREAEANVETVGAEDEPRVTMNIGEPTVRFQRAEPNVEIEGEPQVNFERTGEPRINFRRGQNGEEMTVGDLEDRTVISSDGEEIGEIDRVVQLGSSVYAVLENGGFFGLGGKEIPIPLSDLTMRNGELVAENMTRARIEELSDRELPDDLDMQSDQRLTLRSPNQ